MSGTQVSPSETYPAAAEQKSSFTRGIFAGVVVDSLLFPYPRRLDERNADEARTVRRLIKTLREMEGNLIDSARFDQEEAIPENVIRAFAEIGMLGLTIAVTMPDRLLHHMRVGIGYLRY